MGAPIENPADRKGTALRPAASTIRPLAAATATEHGPLESRSLNIVQLNSYDYGGGAEAVARLSHRALNQMGHHSQLLVARKTRNDVDIDRIPWYPGPKGFLRIARKIESVAGLQNFYAPAFRKVADAFSFTAKVVHLHCLHGAEGWADLSGVAALAKRYPLIVSLHDIFLMTGHCVHGMECERWKQGCGQCPDLNRYPAISRDGTAWNWRRKKKLFARHSPHLIAVSEWVKSQALMSPVLRHCPIHIVPNPIDLQTFTDQDRLAARQRFGIPADQPTVLLAANQLSSPFKGAADGIHVLNNLVNSAVLALVVGQDCEEISKEIKIPARYLGYIDTAQRMADCYRAADVFLIPSRIESFGLVAAEAAACGSAVVSFHAGGLREVVETANGISVPDGDAAGLTAAVRHLLDHPEDREARVRIGRQRVIARYSPEIHASECVKVYRQAIESFHHH